MDATRVTWMLADNQQSVRDVTDNTGLPIDHIDYDSYGNVLSERDPTYQPRFGYTGMQTDPESGLLYDQARYYNSGTGNFVVEDPKGFAAGDGNLYRYVGNDPTNRVDPTGLQERGPAEERDLLDAEDEQIARSRRGDPHQRSDAQ